MQVVTERRPTEAEWQELLVRLEGLQARQVQRDRDLARPGRRSGSAPAR